MKTNVMRIYQVLDCKADIDENGCMFIAAHSVKEAKKIGFPWFIDSEWIDIRVKWIRWDPQGLNVGKIPDKDVLNFLNP